MKIHILNKTTTMEIDTFETVKDFEFYVSEMVGFAANGFEQCASIYHAYNSNTLCVIHKMLDYAKDRLRANK